MFLHNMPKSKIAAQLFTLTAANMSNKTLEGGTDPEPAGAWFNEAISAWLVT